MILSGIVEHFSTHHGRFHQAAQTKAFPFIIQEKPLPFHIFPLPLHRLTEKECLVTSFKTKQDYDTKQDCECVIHADGHTLLYLLSGK